MHLIYWSCSKKKEEQDWNVKEADKWKKRDDDEEKLVAQAKCVIAGEWYLRELDLWVELDEEGECECDRLPRLERRRESIFSYVRFCSKYSEHSNWILFEFN